MFFSGPTRFPLRPPPVFRPQQALTTALPLPGADCPANDDSALCGDAAENSIPRYLITFTDDKGKEQTCRASARQSYPQANPTAFAFPYRHRFRDSMAVLASMLFLLVGGVLVILRKRDTDPQ